MEKTYKNLTGFALSTILCLGMAFSASAQRVANTATMACNPAVVDLRHRQLHHSHKYNGQQPAATNGSRHLRHSNNARHRNSKRSRSFSVAASKRKAHNRRNRVHLIVRVPITPPVQLKIMILAAASTGHNLFLPQPTPIIIIMGAAIRE
ncbi:hypothetical protein HK413_13160 [Mucilaginibacter sp. S1162]|uniref:Uncharacterized protein n=1 Tax=Mucilaginibacter humi TaxID=2732510 RepID=A0ABX1W3M4_9SPHI|nr:hypothetical protein [Mucilaginibacter humi]NNU34768.1 hypothetical protein [Mucilaginibacter humi]